jgi:NADH-ubiquinone oxidoreductase chain 2
MIFSSFSWFLSWMFLEINIFFITSIIKKERKKENIIKYFIIQRIRALIILWSVSLEKENNLVFSFLIQFALIIKIAIFPFHFWFPEILSKTKFLPRVILITWQKRAPLFLIRNLKNRKIFFLSVISSIWIRLTILFSKSLNKIISLSSIRHLGWIVFSIFKNLFSSFIYFFIYSITLLQILIKTKLSKKKNQISLKRNFLLILILSFGGIPPFLGFFPKWNLIKLIQKIQFLFPLLILFLRRTINLYIYLKHIIPSIFRIKTKKINKIIRNNFTLILNFSFPLIFLFYLK